MAMTTDFREHEPGRRRDDRRPPASTAADVDRAVAAAKAAFALVAARPGAEARRDPLPRSRASSSAKEAVTRLVTREMGKVNAEARGDVQEAIDMAYLVAGEGRRLFGQTTPCELPNKWT